MNTIPTSYQELYRTDKGSVYQCDATSRIVLEFWDSFTPMSPRDFVQFRRMVRTIDVRQMALSTDAAHDVEILALPKADRCYVLTLCEVIHLRELLNGATAMLELNSMLRECGCSVIAA
ncbi:hypothetical protein [Spirosoma montaniterrae]|uniref:hypothetical protein n=1 Tax=Spirosoma montaniterrae TaxID=1178516 RepID=UPI001E54E28A|nr:hypothetical protein [Spirosoma montaniterrae]